MFLKNIDIQGFQGINRLNLELQKEGCVLIGENTWGKSSLLGALSLLCPERAFYQLTETDFYYAPNQCNDDCHVKIRFIFCEYSIGQFNQNDYQLFQSIKYKNFNDPLQYIAYEIQAKKSKQEVTTERYFLDANGNQILDIDNIHLLIEQLIRLHPILRLKNPLNGDSVSITTNQPLSEYYIELLSKQLNEQTKNIESQELYQGLKAGRALLEYYLVDHKKRYNIKHISGIPSPALSDWNSLEKVNQVLEELDDNHIRSILLAVFTALLNAKGDNKIAPNAIPIFLLEEPESQLHPIILSIALNLLNNLPVQKIITTNSSDLISLTELSRIYRLIRTPEQIMAYHVAPNNLNASDHRRIVFHILYRRASALFARNWLLVEGETEVWMLQELASQCGYHLNSEGVQLIEFAQCGLRPLIKFAQKMGIRWYVLTDGDQAGKKYADTVRSMIPDSDDCDDYLTVLPAKDMENFMFRQGFSHVYKLAVYGTTNHIDIPVSRIIQKAIHKTSKPDLAVAVCDDARQRGAESIPHLLKKMFANVVRSAKKNG